jgi:serine protease inhibitor
MKKHSIPIPLFFLALILAGACGKDEPVQKEPGTIEMAFKSREIIDASHTFGFELFREICATDTTENIMISPISVSCALGMTFNGARNATEEAFRKVLHFGGLTRQEVNQSYQSLMTQIEGLDPAVEFSVANSIWYRTGFEVLQEFIDINREYFDAEVSEADFSDPATVDMINDWIEVKTHDKIKDMLDYIPVDAVMYLINAIYFNAPWKYEFDPSDTYNGDFHLEKGGTCTAAFMQGEGDFLYYSTEDFQAVALPYGDSVFSMVVILPDPDIGISTLIQTMDETNWQLWFSEASVTGVHVHLPKYKYGFKSLLNESLKNLGLEVAFSNEADFTGIYPPGGIGISRVIHQTFIDVMEEGTEAAAATIVELNYCSISENRLEFKVNRPFLYIIRENSTGAILFMGKVGRPEYDY